MLYQNKADKSASNSLNPSIFEGLVTLCVPDFHLVCRFPYYSFNTYAKKLVLLYYSTLLYTRKNITVLTPENKKRTADTYTRTVLLLPKSTQHGNHTNCSPSSVLLLHNFKSSSEIFIILLQQNHFNIVFLLN